MKCKTIFLTLSILVLSCSKPTDPHGGLFSSYQYPLHIHNSWKYLRTITHSNIQPDTSSIFIPTNIIDSTLVRIDAIDTLGTSTDVVRMIAFELDSSHLYHDTAIFFFQNEEDGLYEYGNIGGNLAVPVSRPPTGLEIEQHIQSLINKKEIKQFASADGAKQSLRYPIRIGSKWTFLDDENIPFGIEKQVIKYENLITPAGKFTCFVVEWEYTNTNTAVIDYYSQIGLVKRVISDHVTICTFDGDCVSADIAYEYKLMEFQSAPEPALRTLDQ